jgi:hypothetical protein
MRGGETSMGTTKNYRIRNQTPYELVLLGKDHVLRLAPLQRQSVGGHPAKLFGDAANFAKHDRVLDWEVEPVRARRLLTMAWSAGVGFAGLAAGIVGALFGAGRWSVWTGAIWCVLCLALAVGAATVFDTPVDSGVPRTELDPSPIRSDAWDLLRDLAISVTQGMVAVLLIVIAIGTPALAVYYGTDLSEVVKLSSWNRIELPSGSDKQYIVVARCLQLVLLILMSVLPALMFFQFDREKLTTMVDRWMHAIFRLDPSLNTVSDVDAKYGRRVEEFFGAALGTGVLAPRRRLRNHSPVLITTVLIAIGWIVVLVNSGRSLPDNATFQDFFEPPASPMMLAFLGAYFLCIQVALRGYVRGDLKPKTYNILTVRILMAVILAWALQALLGTNTTTLALAFLSGVTPNTVLRRIRDISIFDWAGEKAPAVLRTRPKATAQSQAADDELAGQSPLTVLDEIDVYERTRLEEEGITCVQALARHDLVDLMLSSRIPVARLVDWVDQAILHQHVPTNAAALRLLGIRTATDFLRAWDAILLMPAQPGKVAREALEKALSPGQPDLLRSVLIGDEWLRYVTNWRDHDGTDAGPILVYKASGEAVQVPRGQDNSAPTMFDLRVIDVSDYPPHDLAVGAAAQVGAPVGHT